MSFLLKLGPVFQSAKTDNTVFKLYYRYTVLILLLFALVITCRLFFGDSFVCEADTNRRSFVNAVCYTTIPFIVTEALSEKAIKTRPYPGIEASSSGNRVYPTYYPWVNLFFLVLAILFYLPHLIWKIFEGGLVTRLTSKVNNSSVNEAERKAAIIETAKYFITTRGGHLRYVIGYLLSEIINWLVGLLLTLWLLNFFNVDMHYSSDEFKMKTWDDFFAYNFPLMGKCEYSKFGSSGAVQTDSTLCHMPLNNLYGYMCLFLFAWFILICILQALVIPCRFVELILEPIRVPLFTLRSGVSDRPLLNKIDSLFSLGDWFLLTRLQKNLLTNDLVLLLMYVQNNFSKSQLDLEMDDLSKLI